MSLPEHGLSHDEVLAQLSELRTMDKDWTTGRFFGLVFNGGGDVHDVAKAAADLYMWENALNPMVFPSLGYLQQAVVDATIGMFHGGDEAAGFMTSGGTESILMAVKAARNRFRKERGLREPEMVIPESAHAAFHKAGEYFDVKVNKVAVRDDWRADIDAMRAAVNDNTVLIVGSAPQYPQGVIDPIPELAALAAERDINCHVDACMGGFVLPFAEQLGMNVAPWDFRVDGVTSISADVHKLGYSPKGASVIVHRNETLRNHHTFLFDDWLGGFYASAAMLGTKPSAPIAAAWAVMNYLGEEGYRERVRVTLETHGRLVAGIRATPGLRVLGKPEAQLFATAADDGLDIFAIGDVLSNNGWMLDRQKPPDNLHATVSYGNRDVVDDFIGELRAAVDEVGGTRTDDRSTSYASLE